MLTDIDYFLRDASFGFARIIQGEIPDGSGTSIGDVSGLDGAFLLAGRSENQIGHGGQTAQGYLALSSTTHTTKGKIYLGDAMTQGAFDEANGWLGLGTISPTAILTLANSGVGVSNAIPTTTISGRDSLNNQWAGFVVGEGGAGSTPNLASEVDEGIAGADDFTTYIRSNGNPSDSYSRCVLGLNTTIPSVAAVYTITYRVTLDTNSSSNGSYFFQLYRADGNGEVSETITVDSTTYTPGTWFTRTATVTMGASPSLSGGTANSLGIRHNGNSGGTRRILITAISIASGGTAGDLTRWYTVGGATLTSIVDQSGRFGVGTTGTLSSMLSVTQAPTDTNIISGFLSVGDRVFNVDNTGVVFGINMAIDQNGYAAGTTATFSTPALTADRSIFIPDATGTLLIRTGTTVNTTGRTTSVATTNLVSSPTTQMYQINAFMHCSTAGDAGDNVKLNLLWDDGSGVKTISLMTLDLAAVGNYASYTIAVYHTTGTNLRYSTTLVSPGAGTPAHSIRLRATALG